MLARLLPHNGQQLLVILFISYQFMFNAHTKVRAVEMPIELLTSSQPGPRGIHGGMATGAVTGGGPGIGNGPGIGKDMKSDNDIERGPTGHHGMQFALIGKDILTAFYNQQADNLIQQNNENPENSENDPLNYNHDDNDIDNANGNENGIGNGNGNVNVNDDNDEEFMPIWLQHLHNEPINYNKNRNKLTPQYKHNNKNKAKQQNFQNSIIATATTTRQCSIEITTKIPGVCQPITPLGSACVSGEYMDLLSDDCL